MLVAGEVALALMLMAGAGLLIRSALLVSHLDPGFDTSNLIVGRVGLPDIGYHDPTVARQTFERMITAAEALPGVQSAGSSFSRSPGWRGQQQRPDSRRQGTRPDKRQSTRNCRSSPPVISRPHASR